MCVGHNYFVLDEALLAVRPWILRALICLLDARFVLDARFCFGRVFICSWTRVSFVCVDARLFCLFAACLLCLVGFCFCCWTRVYSFCLTRAFLLLHARLMYIVTSICMFALVEALVCVVVRLDL